MLLMATRVCGFQVALFDEQTLPAVQELVAELIFSDAEVICVRGSDPVLSNRLEKFGYIHTEGEQWSSYCRFHPVQLAASGQGMVVYMRDHSRLFVCASGAEAPFPCKAKGCSVRGWVSCQDSIQAGGGLHCYPHPKTEQGKLKIARCEWCSHR